MTLQRTLIAAAAALAALGSLPAGAQTLEEMRDEIRKLRNEVNELKRAQQGAKPAETAGWGDRIEQLELKQKDNVVAGDIGGGFRIPGSETTVRLYGYAEANLIHDIKRPGPSDLFTDLMFQPLDGRDAAVTKGKTRLTASTSRFGFETSTPTGAGSLSTKLEMDFYSYGSDTRNRLRLRHAYGEYAGFLVGQTWSTFMDLDNLPETVDFNGPIGSPFSRRTMVRYTYGDAKAGYKLTAALEDPENGARLPNLVARYDRSFDGGSFNVRVLSHEKRVGSESKRGSGFGLGASYKLTSDDVLMGQWARVNGDYDMMYGSPGYAVDGNGKLQFDKNDGLVLGWAHTFSPQLRSNLVLGMNRSRADADFIAANDAALSDLTNKRLTQWHLGFIYSPIKNVELGAEYIQGLRKTFSGDKGTMSRVDLLGRYSF